MHPNSTTHNRPTVGRAVFVDGLELSFDWHEPSAERLEEIGFFACMIRAALEAANARSCAAAYTEPEIVRVWLAE